MALLPSQPRVEQSWLDFGGGKSVRQNNIGALPSPLLSETRPAAVLSDGLPVGRGWTDPASCSFHFGIDLVDMSAL